MRVLRRFQIALMVGLLAYGVSFKVGWLPPYPKLIAAGAGLALLGFAVLFVAAAAALVRRPGERLRHAAALLVCGGFLLTLGAGMANWLFSIQGYVVLEVGEVSPLFMTGHLDHFAAGPWSNLEEADAVLELVDVELTPDGEGSYLAASRLRVSRPDGTSRLLDVGAGSYAADGTLVFHQGAFGYVAELHLEKEGKVLLQEAVPFITERRGPRLVFNREIDVDGLTIRGEVHPSVEESRVRGHPQVFLTLSRDGQLLGRGPLQPGHFVDLESGHKVGLTGMRHWAEIDISRRNYPQVLLGGLAAAAAGLLLFVVAGVRRRLALPAASAACPERGFPVPDDESTAEA